MVVAILGVLFVFLVTLAAAVLLMRGARRLTGEPADDETARAAAAITTITSPKS